MTRSISTISQQPTELQILRGKERVTNHSMLLNSNLVVLVTMTFW